jgi:hypothetical protein
MRVDPFEITLSPMSILLIHCFKGFGDTGSVKLEIKLNPQDIEEIARRLTNKISESLMEMEARIRKSQTPAERPDQQEIRGHCGETAPVEKVWKMVDGEWWNDK